MTNIKRTVLAFFASVLLLAGMPMAAHADTATCNATAGNYCGEVVNKSTSLRSIIIADHEGRTAYVYPGQSSKAAGIRDVAKFWRPSGYVTKEWLGGVYKGCYSGGTWRTNLPDQVENWQVEVRRSC